MTDCQKDIPQLEIILEGIGLALEFVKGMNVDEFLRDDRSKSAVLM
jgi:uncharacterized protein with HEPN domain